MQRIRFLTAITVGSEVLSGLSERPQVRDAAPFLIWEWLVVESLVRSAQDMPLAGGVAGSQVVRRALDGPGYVDAGGYLKTPRIFGFHGVYKRLAVQLGLIDVHLRPGPNARLLIDAWSKGFDGGTPSRVRELMDKWKAGVARSLGQRAPRTDPGWRSEAWEELASAFHPDGAKSREKRWLRERLLVEGEGQVGALKEVWEQLERSADGEVTEPELHRALKRQAPGYQPLIDAIQAYERFARSLQDGFDGLRFSASIGAGFLLARMTEDAVITKLAAGISRQYAEVERKLDDVAIGQFAPQVHFRDRFRLFAEVRASAAFVGELCAHHERVQQGKGSGGKRAWFDRLGPDQIYLRQSYRLTEWEPRPKAYVHDYRMAPIGRFRKDLA